MRRRPEPHACTCRLWVNSERNWAAGAPRRAGRGMRDASQSPRLPLPHERAIQSRPFLWQQGDSRPCEWPSCPCVPQQAPALPPTAHSAASGVLAPGNVQGRSPLFPLPHPLAVFSPGQCWDLSQEENWGRGRCLHLDRDRKALSERRGMAGLPGLLGGGGGLADGAGAVGALLGSCGLEGVTPPPIPCTLLGPSTCASSAGPGEA